MLRHKKGLQVNECLNVQGSNSMRTLIAASLAALSMNGVYASDLAPVPQTATNDNNQTSNLAPVPSTEKGSAYTLTKVSEGGEKPEGDNIVTKFTYNAETKVMTPVYYRLTLNKTAYGEGDTTKYYGWTKSDDGNRTFGDVSQADADITYSYNTPSSSLEHIDYDKSPAVDAVTGDFVGQTAVSGGAIHNVATNIGTITGNFINNSASNNGGAISHIEANGGGRIDTIQGNFIGNNVQYNGRYSSSYGYGGAIYSIEDIGSIKGDFVGNYVQSNQSGMGGAIANVYIGYYGSIGGITGDFIGNYVSAERAAYGGAIANSSSSTSVKPSIRSITGDFTGNYTVSTNSMASGGAIYNENGTIGFVNGNFIGNYAQGSYAYGGAISNNENATISGVSGDFIGNYAASSGEANGGAIYNTGTLLGYDVPNDKVIGLVSATYINSDTGESFTVYYLQSGDSVIPAEDLSEALSMGYKVTNIGNEKAEVGNEAYQQMLSEVDAMVSSGVVFRDDPTQGLDSDVFAQPIGITGDFIGNYAKSDNSNAKGGAIYNTSSSSNINKIEGDFISNYVSAEGNAFGGAIANDIGRVDTGSNMTVHSITNIKGDFINNHAESVSGNAQGGAIYNASGYGVYYSTIIGEIGNIQGNFIGNYAKSTDGDASGGAIYNNGNINSIENSSFINNYAVSQNGTAKGGAIYTTSDLTLGATDGYTSIISGNYVEDKNGKRPEAIYVEDKATIGFDATNNGKFVIDDSINGSDGYTVSFDGDETGAVYLNNNIESVDYSSGTTGTANVNLSNITLNLGREDVLDNNNLTLNSGAINMINNQSGVSALNSMTVNGDINMMADVDLANQTMDRFSANSYGQHKGNVNVVGMNLLSDAPEGREVTDIYFAQIGLKDNVSLGVGDLPDNYQTTAYTPIYKYHVMYDNRDDGGYFMFTKGDNVFTPGGGTSNSGNPSDAFNPAILSSPVAAQAGAYAAQNAAFTYAFTHADTFMPLPSVDRFALRHANEYAINSYDSLTMQMNDLHEKGMWVRPYTSFESIPLKNGPDVDTITYGTMIGGDSDFKELRNGWGTVFTGYVGYNGSSQSYSGVNTYQNGGLLGATQTFYKGNFFTAITASVGASAGESHNMYGTDNFAMLMAGVASKSGYNIEFKDGRFIIQPSLLLSYSFINTFDYKTASGVTMDSDPMHAIQINPNVKFIANLKNGWQPYASVGMVWNLLDGTNVRANTVRLPEMSVKPYVEYGLGIQKRWKDKFTGYAQAMVRNGGRNGIALTAGFRWALGKDGKNIDKVQNIDNKITKKTPIFKLSSMGNNQDSVNKTVSVMAPIPEITKSFAESSAKTVTDHVSNAAGKKIIKQLTQAQKTALGARPQNTTRTTNIGILKQL